MVQSLKTAHLRAIILRECPGVLAWAKSVSQATKK